MENRKFNIILILSLLLCLTTSGQQNSKFTFPKYSVGTSISSLLNTKSGVQISQKLRVHPKLALAAETAYLFPIPLSDLKQHNGVRLKGGMEYILASNSRAFVTLDHYYIYRFDESRRGPISGFCIFGCSSDIRTDRITLISGLVGVSLQFKIAKKWQAKIGFAAGPGRLKRATITSPNETYGVPFSELLPQVNESPNFSLREEQETIPSGSFNLNFSYTIID